MSRDDQTPQKDDDAALDLQIAETLRVGVPVATVAGAAVAGYLAGAPAVVLVLAAGTLVSVIAIFWSSVRTLVGETPLSGADAYALGAPRAEEEQKRAVLRALKDLEFERSVGKISEDDYQALVAKYRGEAKRLLRVLDAEAEPARLKVEALVERRLVAEGLREATEVARDDEDDAPAKKKVGGEKPAGEKPAGEKPTGEKPTGKKPSDQKPAKVHCTKCGAKNDADALFCKKCGARQSADDDDEDDVEESKEAAS